MLRNNSINEQKPNDASANEEQPEGFSRLSHITILHRLGQYALRITLNNSQSVPSSRVATPTALTLEGSISSPQTPQNTLVNPIPPSSSPSHNPQLRAAPAG